MISKALVENFPKEPLFKLGENGQVEWLQEIPPTVSLFIDDVLGRRLTDCGSFYIWSHDTGALCFSLDYSFGNFDNFFGMPFDILMAKIQEANYFVEGSTKVVRKFHYYLYI